MLAETPAPLLVDPPPGAGEDVDEQPDTSTVAAAVTAARTRVAVVGIALLLLDGGGTAQMPLLVNGKRAQSVRPA
jgi:hypothetical protein